MKKTVFLSFFFFALLLTQSKAQTGIYIPLAPGARPSLQEMQRPSQFEVLVSFEKGSMRYSLDAIDILDSVYKMSFAKENPHFYRLEITGYDDGDSINAENNTLARDRVETVYNYFLARTKTTDYLVRTAYNEFYGSCGGIEKELVRYKVPVDFNYVSLINLKETEKTFGKNIPLSGKVRMKFISDTKACLGDFSNCYIPRQDTIIRSSYSNVMLSKGCLYQKLHTKDSCNSQLTFSIEEHLDHRKIIENYFLVPNPKQLIVQCGYFILRSDHKIKYGECKNALTDSIFLRFPATAEQLENKIKFIGKVYTDKDVQFKALKTKKISSKISPGIQCAINPTQIDTIFIGKRITEEELKDYFYPAKENEPGAFRAKGKFYKAFKYDKNGEMILRKEFEKLFRISEEETIDLDAVNEEEEVD